VPFSSGPGDVSGRPKLIFLVGEDVYFWSHRLPMAQAARGIGLDVAVATRLLGNPEGFRAAGLRLHELDWRRTSVGLIDNIRAIVAISRLYRRERPALVHHVAIKPSVIGGIAAAMAGAPAVVSSINGLGFVFTDNGVRARLLRWPIAVLLRTLLGRRNTWMLLQNPDDRDRLHELGIGALDRTVVIRGSGVDTDFFRPAPEPGGPITVGFVGRMIEIKGVRTLVAAQQQLMRRGLDIRLILAGPLDPQNPGAIPEAELRGWKSLPGIIWNGYCSDVRAIWQQAHIACQVAVGEGLPKSLLEAAAMGRPIVASDQPGCREVARAGINALLVPPGDIDALADALALLAGDPVLRRRFGEASRRIVDPDLSARTIGAETAALYRRVLSAIPGTR
jgi:glycosyltransferase involved in cell wall biosynthesis